MKDGIEIVTWWKDGFKSCPDCNGIKFLRGPKGGLSVNFKCEQCGSKFNHMGPFGIERIGEKIV